MLLGYCNADYGAGGHSAKVGELNDALLHGYCNADYGAGGYSAEVGELNDAAWLL